nr:MAG TPA: hypothetical protein [Caudoviricetes sp.]
MVGTLLRSSQTYLYIYNLIGSIKLFVFPLLHV